MSIKSKVSELVFKVHDSFSRNVQADRQKSAYSGLGIPFCNCYRTSTPYKFVKMLTTLSDSNLVFNCIFYREWKAEAESGSDCESLSLAEGLRCSNSDSELELI